jgi:hypothetical protein
MIALEKDYSNIYLPIKATDVIKTNEELITDNYRETSV